MFQTWEISLQLYISLFETGGLRSILRLSNTDTDSNNIGDRIFAVFLHEETQELRFYYDVKDEPVLFAFYGHVDKISANTWYTLRVEQVFDRGEFMLRIFLDGEMIKERALKYTPTTYDNVVVYMGDQFYPSPISGYVDQLNIKTGRSKVIND